ncbi:lysozyme inhibitor LprI family protein [Massilia sp. TN1-12]
MRETARNGAAMGGACRVRCMVEGRASMKRLPLAAWVLAGLAATTAQATTFDCRKAGTAVEKTICADPALSRLDERLGAAYKEAMHAGADRPALVASQRRWIAETRDRCPDAACIARSYEARIAWLAERGKGHGGACPVQAAQLRGSWIQAENDDFEESAIATLDGIQSFTSWRHHRPEMVGNWVLRDCVLHIDTHTDGKLDFDYRIIGVRGNVLHLENAETGDAATYRREAIR